MAAIEVHRVKRATNHDRAVVAPSHRLFVRPIGTDGDVVGDPIDVTDSVIGAVAHSLWQHTKGNETLNWLEAERLIQHLLDLAWDRQNSQQPALASQEIEVTPDPRQTSAPASPLKLEKRPTRSRQRLAA